MSTRQTKLAKVILFIFIFFVMAAFKGLYSEETATKEIVLNAYKYQSSLIRNITIELEKYAVPFSSIEKNKPTSKFKFIREGDKKIVEETSLRETPQDAEVFTKFLYDKTTGTITRYTAEISSSGVHKNKTGGIDSLDAYSWPYRFQDIVGDIHIGGRRVLDLLENANTKIISTNQNLNGTLCWLLQGECNDTKEKYEVWIDPQVGFMPIFIKVGNIGSEKSFFEVHFENYKEIYPGVWFPMAQENKFTSKSNKLQTFSGTNITIPAITYGTYVVTSIKLNTGLPSGVFNIIFPSGTKVRDNFIETEYAVP